MRNRIVELMGEKQARDKRLINAATVAREIGITPQAVSKWVRNDITEYRVEMINKFCEYFGCEAGDLIVYEPDNSDKEVSPQ